MKRDGAVEVSVESDAALVAQLRAQERGAFDRLYALHHERIWRFLLRLSGRRDEAEDLFQETWVQAARHAHRLEVGSRLLPWLFTIARNQHRSARRFLLFDFRKRETLAVEPTHGPRDPEDLILDLEEAHQLEAALAAIGEAHREVLLLAHVEGLPSADIAAVLGQSDDAVRKRLSRARAELRQALETAQKAGGRRPSSESAADRAVAGGAKVRDPS
jgi:RNA polymerase sigma-70 factor, ECF subfamily